jgi:hypothetical protein
MRSVAVEWIGHPSIFDDPRVLHGRLTGAIGERELRILRVAASKRIYRRDGVVIRILSPGDPPNVPGLSREYQWGPETASYVQEMPESDWEIIQATAAAKQFRDVTAGMPKDRFSLPPPPDDLLLVKEEEFRSVKELLNADKVRA